MRSDEAGLTQAVESLTGRRVSGSERLTGGDFAQSFRFDLDDGTRLFAKTHPNPRPGFFATEAAGLAWLRCADAVPVPEVLAASDGGADGSLAMLIMEWIPPAAGRPADDQAFGAALARLHDAGAPSFGRADRRTTGSLGLPNDPCEDWATFYASCRLLPLARLAADAKALPATTIGRLERLAHSLDAFDDGEPPARLHGDLWAGNRIVDSTGRSWLIDPAAHGGHREFDLAMMRLFGGFGQECFAAYAHAHPLPTGWQDRVQLHQIAPLVVHAIKFGRSYVDAATAAIMRY
ncbi:MAG: putative ribulosamine/erythrulosamine 3-kinase [Acidimicrobiales bacterium]|nr:putative ribulosamine/erythrulosamine 3-kinase [Acidimicrobiales bacterium]